MRVSKVCGQSSSPWQNSVPLLEKNGEKGEEGVGTQRRGRRTLREREREREFKKRKEVGPCKAPNHPSQLLH